MREERATILHAALDAHRLLARALLHAALPAWLGLDLSTGKRILEGVEAAQAVRRGDVRRAGAAAAQGAGAAAREVPATFSWLATMLQRAA